MSHTNEIHGQKPVLVHFFASWCPTCRLQSPVVLEVKDQVGERATILNIDIDKNQRFAESSKVETVPTLIIFSEVEELWRKNGPATVHEILDQLNVHIE